MKIYVLGSTSFVKEMVNIVDELKKLGHDGWIHPHYIDYVNQENHPHLKKRENGEHAQVKLENDYINQHYKNILGSDAVLVINLEKNGIKNYIGGNVLIEMGQAYVNNKKIFLLNSVPEMNYSDEIISLKPIELNGDISKISMNIDIAKIPLEKVPTLKEISNEGNLIEDEIGVNLDDILNKLTQEFGEFNDATQKFRGKYSRKKVPIEEVEKELGDVIFNLISICNRLGINPNEFNKFAFNTLNKFKERKEDYKLQ